jgi:hypothetical protein
MKLFFAVAVAVASVIPSLASQSLGFEAAFPLLPASKCDDVPDVRQCHVAGPKDWTAEERLQVEESLQRLAANELVRGILVRAHENGYRGLRRYSTDTRRDPTHGPVPKFSPGFVLFAAKVIGITDAFFQTSDLRDPIADYRFGDFILLHELIHAFDDRKASIEPAFVSATGWVFRNNRWEYTNPVSLSAYNGVFAETVTLYARGRYTDAWTKDRSFATSMSFPLPTIQSLATPGESFADILAHLILDPTATSYLKPSVVEWFHTQVFPALQRDAQRASASLQP